MDAVYVATPVFLHAPQTIQSLRAGKHVICEKPMAMNEPEARSMVQAAEQSGRHFGVAYYRRCYPKVQRAKQLLQQGRSANPSSPNSQTTCGSTEAAAGVGWSILQKLEAARSSTSLPTVSTC